MDILTTLGLVISSIIVYGLMLLGGILVLAIVHKVKARKIAPPTRYPHTNHAVLIHKEGNVIHMDLLV